MGAFRSFKEFLRFGDGFIGRLSLRVTVTKQGIECLASAICLRFRCRVERTFGGQEPLAEIQFFLLENLFSIVFPTLSRYGRIEVQAHSTDVQMRAAVWAGILPGQRQ